MTGTNKDFCVINGSSKSESVSFIGSLVYLTLKGQAMVALTGSAVLAPRKGATPGGKLHQVGTTSFS